MFLEKIEIQGFKSFANKTVLEFPEKSHNDPTARSVAAIVGPNGSGKSNTADAIRWVLGEQSVKNLRGKKSEDVIFAGSTSKARLGFAEVSLYLNNEEKTAPIDYTHIVITRRIFRDGEGEYLINKNKVRLFDVLMLLAKANFGQKSYSIVGQGMVDHIINISPWERKEFFDEATGVKQYQIKRDQSVSKLTRAKENLEQTNQILAELEPRLRLLTKQIKKLEKRKEVEKELQLLQNKYYAHIWEKLKTEKQKLDENFNIKDSLKKEVEARLNDIQVKLATLAKEESRREIFDELQKKYNKLTVEKNEILKDLSVLKGKMSLEYSKVGKQNLSWLEDKKEEITNRINEVKESFNNSQSKNKTKQELLKTTTEKFENISREVDILRNNLQQATQELDAIKNGRQQNNNHYAIKQVLSLKSQIPGIYGTVGQLGRVEEMYEPALAVAVGNRMNAIVVQDDKVAVQCINYLKENRAGLATFLPLNKIKTYKINQESRQLLIENGAIGFAVELVSYEQKFKKVFEHVFGSTIVIDSASHATQIGIGKERLVTLEGDLFEKNGVMRGGYQKKGFLNWFVLGDSKASSNQEEKLKEIELAKVKIESLVKQKEKLNLDINEIRVDLQVNETKQKGLQNDLESLQKEKEKISAEISENQISPKDEKKFLKQLQVNKIQLENKQEQLEEQLFSVKTKIDDFNIEEEKKKILVFQLQDEMQNYQIKLNDINNEYNDIRISLAKLETRKEEFEKEVSQELGAIKLEELKATETINPDQLWFEISKVKKNLELIGGIDPEVVDEHKEVSERYEFLSSQVADLESAIKDLSKVIEELDLVIEKQFTLSFHKINKSFEHYFKKIFEGGKAKLTLVQKEDPKKKQQRLQDEQGNLIVEDDEELIDEKPEFTQTGVDIYVSPPNKKLQSIAALSGGERTMTSLALLCAIIENNPSPFVVMDEVDAALDETNSERFAKIIEELSYKTQFVLITHNRVIMHVADILYGVAMGEDGVSKTLSLDLKEAEKIGEKA